MTVDAQSRESPFTATPEVLAGIVETMSDAVIVCDLAGHVVFANRQASELSGYAPDELLALRIDDLVPARVRAAHHGNRAGYARQASARPMGTGLDTRLLRRDGQELAVDIALSPVRGGGAVVAALRDVTEQRAVHARVRDQAQLLDHAHDAMLVRRFDDGAITYWNRGAAELYGYSAEEALGRVSHELLQTRFPGSRDELEMALAREGRWDGDLDHARRDGTRVLVSSRQVLTRDTDDDRLSVFEISRDITAERRTHGYLSALLDVAEAIMSEQESDAVLGLIAERARELVGAAFVGLSLRDGDSFVIRAGSGDAAPRVVGMRMPASGSISGRALLGGEPLFVDDIAAHPDVHRPFADATGLGPGLFIPLTAAALPIGTLVVANPPGSPSFSQQELGVLVDLFGAIAGIAVEHGRARAALRDMAILEDRERIARELHDGAIQTLFAVGMSLESTVGRIDDPEVIARLGRDVGRIDEVITDLRRYIFGLRPSLAPETGIEDALRQLVQGFSADSGLPTELDVDADALAALQPLEHDLLMAVGEALSNVRKHAEARHVSVSVAREGTAVTIVVADDGRGFNPARGRRGGQGLRNLRERAGRMGGALAIDSRRGAGTRVRISIPS